MQINEVGKISGPLLLLVGLVRLDPRMIEGRDKAMVNGFQSFFSVHFDIQFLIENLYEFLTIVSFVNFFVNWGFNLNIN